MPRKVKTVEIGTADKGDRVQQPPKIVSAESSSGAELSQEKDVILVEQETNEEEASRKESEQSSVLSKGRSIKKDLLAAQLELASLGRAFIQHDALNDADLGKRSSILDVKTRCLQVLERASTSHLELLSLEEDTAKIEAQAENLQDNVYEVLNACTKALERCTLSAPKSKKNPVAQQEAVDDELLTTRSRSANETPCSSSDLVDIARATTSTPMKSASAGNNRQTPAGLNPHAPHFYGNEHSATPYVRSSLDQCQYPVLPGPRLSLGKFSGDILQYGNFRRKFMKYVEEVYSDDDTRMSFLEESCIGKAYDVIAGLCCFEDRKAAYNQAWARLDKRFGDGQKLLAHVKRELLNGPLIKEWDSKALLDLSDKMYKCETSFSGWGRSGVLESEELMENLFARLPYKVKTKFVAVSNTGINQGTFRQLREIVEDAASEADSRFGQLLHQGKESRRQPHQAGERSHHGGTSRRITVCATQHESLTEAKTVKTSHRCLLCDGWHPLWKCEKFHDCSVDSRRELVKTNRLCFNCLNAGHRVSDCKWKITCRVCHRRHNTLIHVEQPAVVSKEHVEDSRKVSPPVSEMSACAQTDKMRTIFKVVPVKVWVGDPSKAISTYAFIDEGSSVSLCSISLARRLGVTARDTQNVELVTMNAVTTIKKKLDSLFVQGLEETSAFVLRDSLVVEKIVDVSSSIPTEELASSYSHLRDINFPCLEGRKVELLLGSDLHQAFLYQDIRLGKPGEPSGLRTFLGWTIYGRDSGDHEVNNTNTQVMVNFIQDTKGIRRSCQDMLQVLEQDFQDTNVPQLPCHSIEDKRAISLMEKTIKKVDGHYSVGVLWNQDDPQLPDNRGMALRRLQSLKRRFQEDSELYRKYTEKIMDYLNNGYAEPIPDERSTPKRACYIPHHCTAANTKFRVVFDCSAKCNGVSLNDWLLQGPDLSNNVLGVLLRFRQYPIAVVGDIKAMFSQVLIDAEDKDAFRFFWFPDNDLNADPVAYRMKTHVFGAKSSPTCAAFALRRTAEDNLSGADEKILQLLRRNIYVDDACFSCRTSKEAFSSVTKLCQLLKSGGFHLTKFLSNDRDVLSCIPQEDLAPEINLEHSDLPTHKTLGVYWDAATDRMRVKVNVADKPCTRRGILSTVAGTYDPIGLLQPFLLPAKRLLQEACRAELDWDDEIGDMPQFRADWSRWLRGLPDLEQIALTRSLLLPGKVAVRHDLNIFCDAITSGYGCVAYVRTTYDDHSCNCAFVVAKSRVAPLKTLTIPRLELSAAVLGAKIANLLMRELDLSFSNVYLWSDSVAVLRYLHNTNKRFTTFVANRLTTLHALTNVNQWFYVPSALNPADIASRGVFPDQAHCCEMWLNGPGFLHEIDFAWPKQPDFVAPLPEEDPEIKDSAVCMAQTLTSTNNILDRLFARYSTFHCLQKTVAWLFRFWRFLKDRTKPCSYASTLSAEEMDAARLAIVQAVQRQAFPEVFSVLFDHPDFEYPVKLITEKQLLKNAALRPLQALNPYVVNGVLRVGGRLQKSALPLESIHPAILPRDHPVTNLLVMMTHVNEGHMGTSHVLATMNKSYWIISGRSVVNRIIKGCVNCRFWKATHGRQQMGNLPADRVTKGSPFAATGTDLLGPLLIRSGRNSVKRYICIFNCLASRAVHLEVVQSLESSAFIQAFRRFCSRRNVKPANVYSDNGGNFVAAERELREGIKNWNTKQVHDALLQVHTNWHFNPPRASHQAGFYEAFFRIVRKIMRSLVGEATLSEFDLLTLTAEIERILNDRPITPLPSSPDDLAALTPSIILTGSVCSNLPNDIFMKQDGYRSSWRKTQFLTDKFWGSGLPNTCPYYNPDRSGSLPRRI